MRKLIYVTTYNTETHKIERQVFKIRYYDKFYDSYIINDVSIFMADSIPRDFFKTVRKQGKYIWCAHTNFEKADKAIMRFIKEQAWIR